MSHPLIRRAFGVPSALALLCLLGACATSQTSNPDLRYTAPTAGPSAKLVMRAKVNDGDLYGVFVHDDALACQGPKLAGAGSATRVPVSSALAAGKLTTLDFRVYKADKRTCFVRMSFTPEAGRNYVVAGTMGANVCTARLLDATDPDAIKPVDGALRRNTATQPCVTLAEARPMSSPTVGGQRDGDAVLLPSANSTDLDGLLKP